jgi:hypothetical protein
MQIENTSPYLSPPWINNLNNDIKLLIPDDFFSLIDKPDKQDNEEVIPPEITIYKKRGRPVGFKNKVYKLVLDN